MGQIHIGKGTRFVLNNRSFEIQSEIEKDTYEVCDSEFPAVKETFTRDQIVELMREEKLCFSGLGKNSSKIDWEKYGQINPFEKPTYPLQRVEVDHTQLDLLVVDDESHLPIGRPWITILLDVFTGYPLGLYIGFEPPSYTSVMHALKHGIFPKTYIKTKHPELKNNWVAYGLPEVLVVDNGKEFHSNHLVQACNQLQIELVHYSVEKPWYKGAVERYFRTINQSLIHQTQGITSSNVLDKGEYDPTKNAVVSFNQLLSYFHKWVVDHYANDFNKGVNGVPKELWERSFECIPSPAIPVSSLDWKLL